MKKIVVVGDCDTGKVELLSALTRKRKLNPNEYSPLVYESNLEFLYKKRKKIELNLNDVTGLEEFYRMRVLFYHNADLFIICFNVDQPQTLVNAEKKWYNELKRFRPGVPIILVDLNDTYESELGEVSKKEANECAKRIGAIKYFECTPSEYKGVEEIFTEAVQSRLGSRLLSKCEIL